MGYGLGVDLGTSHTAAAVNVAGRVEAVRLGSRRPEIPSLVFLSTGGDVIVGDAALRRGEGDPARLAREFKRRLGDPVPIILGGAPLSAHALTARLLRHVVEAVTRVQEAAPERIVVTHPANWGPYKRELLAQAVQLADVGGATLLPEPKAAAVRYAGTARVSAGEIVAVYDLGGGTFDAAVLRKLPDGFALLGETEGIEQLGGIDFDEAIFDHVRLALGDALAGLDPDDDAVTQALARLRRDCVEAKESLSFDTETVIAVALPRLHTRVRISRAEFEAMIAPALDDTVAALRRALHSAGVSPDQLRCIVLAGGSARIPLVRHLLSAAFDRPVSPDEQPELGIALGAALLSEPTGTADAPAPPSAPGVAPAVRAPAGSADHPPSGSPGARRSATAAPTSQGGPTTTTPATAAPPLQVGPTTTTPATGPPLTTAPAAASPPGHAAVPATAPTVISELPIGRAAVAPARPRRRPGRAANARAGLRPYRWPLVGVIVAVILAVTAATAWPRSDDGASDTGQNAGQPVSDLVPAASVLWRTPTGGPATEPPAVTADRIIVGGTDGVIRAFHRSDGSPDWSFEAGPDLTVATQVIDSVVYATAGGAVLAVDAATGQELWRRRTGTTFDARPVVGNDRVYAGGRDFILYAYELGGTHRRWRVYTGGEIRTSPTVLDDLAIVASGDGRLYGADGMGRLLWKPRVGQASGGATGAGDAACVPIDDGSVRCVGDDGKVLSRLTLPGVALSSPVGGDGVVYAAADDRTVGAWNARTGALRWRSRPALGGRAAGHPVVRDGEVDVVYPDGRLVGIDAATGAQRWETTLGDSIGTAPRGDEAALFVVGKTGTLHALRTPAGPGTSAVTPSPSVSGTMSKSAAPTLEPPAPTSKPAATTRKPPTRTSRVSPTPTSPDVESPPPTTPPPTTTPEQPEPASPPPD